MNNFRTGMLLAGPAARFLGGGTLLHGAGGLVIAPAKSGPWG